MFFTKIDDKDKDKDKDKADIPTNTNTKNVQLQPQQNQAPYVIVLSENQNDNGSDYFVTDLHGNCGALTQFIQSKKLGKMDRIIIGGDLIDRGPETTQLVKYILALKQKYQSGGDVPQIFCCLGNHERDFLFWYAIKFGTKEQMEKLKARFYPDCSEDDIQINIQGSEKRFIVDGGLLWAKTAEKSDLELFFNYFMEMPIAICVDGPYPYTVVHAGSFCFGNRLKNIAKTAKITVEDFGKALGWTRYPDDLPWIPPQEERFSGNRIICCGHTGGSILRIDANGNVTLDLDCLNNYTHLSCFLEHPSKKNNFDYSMHWMHQTNGNWQATSDGSARCSKIKEFLGIDVLKRKINIFNFLVRIPDALNYLLKPEATIVQLGQLSCAISADAKLLCDEKLFLLQTVFTIIMRRSGKGTSLHIDDVIFLIALMYEKIAPCVKDEHYNRCCNYLLKNIGTYLTPAATNIETKQVRLLAVISKIAEVGKQIKDMHSIDNIMFLLVDQLIQDLTDKFFEEIQIALKTKKIRELIGTMKVEGMHLSLAKSLFSINSINPILSWKCLLSVIKIVEFTYFSIKCNSNKKVDADLKKLKSWKNDIFETLIKSFSKQQKTPSSTTSAEDMVAAAQQSIYEFIDEYCDDIDASVLAALEGIGIKMSATPSVSSATSSNFLPQKI